MTALHLIFGWVLLSSLRASLLTLIVFATQRALRNKLPSRWRYALWLPVLAALVVPAVPLLPSWITWTPPFASSKAPGLDNAVRTPIVVTHTSQPSESIARVNPIAIHPEASSAELSATQTPRASVSPLANALRQGRWGIVAWLVGMAGAISAVMVSFALTMRRIRRGARASDANLLAMVGEIARGVGLARTPRVLQSSAVASPAVCGVWRPTLLLNERFPTNLSAEEADMVLRHELLHIRRGDLALNTLLCSLLALHWFNPLLWIAFSRVRSDREAACDAQVLDGAPATRRAAYGHTLLKMEAELPPASFCLGFVGILQRGGVLRSRIQLIVAQPKVNGTMKSLIAVGILLLTVAGLVKAAEDKPQPTPDQPTQLENKAPDPVAVYPFEKDGKDSVGKTEASELENVTFDQKAMYINGVYGGYDVQVPVPKLNLHSFAVSLWFNPSDSDLQYVLTGGTSGRWFGIKLLNDKLVLTGNNDDIEWTPDLTVSPRQWHLVLCSMDVASHRLMVKLDDQPVAEIKLSEDFDFDNFGLDDEKADRLWSFTNFSIGSGSFKGFARDLSIYDTALSNEAMNAVAAKQWAARDQLPAVKFPAGKPAPESNAAPTEKTDRARADNIQDPAAETAELDKPLDLKFTAVDGTKVDLQSMHGKVVLINFWATWCDPCRAEIPNLRRVYQRLHDRGFEIIGISLDKEMNDLVSVTKKESMTWPQDFDGRGSNNALAKRFGIDSIPKMWLVDKNGNLIDKDAGDNFQDEAEMLLKE